MKSRNSEHNPNFMIGMKPNPNCANMHWKHCIQKQKKKTQKMQKTLDPASFERRSMRGKGTLTSEQRSRVTALFKTTQKWGKGGRIGRIQKRPGKKRILQTERVCVWLLIHREREIEGKTYLCEGKKPYGDWRESLSLFLKITELEKTERQKKKKKKKKKGKYEPLLFAFLWPRTTISVYK